MGSLSRPIHGRRLVVWAALALGWMLPSTGCQVEYAGMTLPSGKYMHDDVQYFAPGPDFPWANTQAASQRARMQAMGMEVPPPGQGGPLTVIPGAGGIPPIQNQGGRPTDINVSPLNDEMPRPGGNVGGPGGVAPGPGPGGAAGPPAGPGSGAAPAAGGASTPAGADAGQPK
ncbi:MAG: hypothetical protein NVSMB9_10250 [Isosphaeraceae bacterium]